MEESHTLENLLELFTVSSSLILVIASLEDKEGLQGSFAKIGWMKAEPKKILLYAQGSKSGKDDLVQLLYRKMFVHAGFNFSLLLGQVVCNGIKIPLRS